MGGKAKALQDGHPRRVSDAKTAWRKASPSQRLDILEFQGVNDIVLAGTKIVEWIGGDQPHNHPPELTAALTLWIDALTAVGGESWTLDCTDGS